MIEMPLRVADLAETSFAVSPLQETVFSLWVWKRARSARRSTCRGAGRWPMQWRRLDTETARGLVSPRGLGAGLPHPASGHAVHGVRRRAGPWCARRRPIACGPTCCRHTVTPPLPEVLLADRRGVAAHRRCARRILAGCLKPSWPRIHAVLEADIVYRSRQLALGGARGIVRRTRRAAALERRRALRRPVQRRAARDRDRRTGPAARPVGVLPRGGHLHRHRRPPLITYPARGRATSGRRRRHRARAALVELLGPPRARLLTLLDRPATTTELAHRLVGLAERGQPAPARPA